MLHARVVRWWMQCASLGRLAALGMLLSVAASRQPALLTRVAKHVSYRFSFPSTQLGVPHVKQQNDALAVGVVPRLVLVGVVKHKGDANLPCPHFAAHSDSAFDRVATWYNEGQVHAQPQVAGTKMGSNLCDAMQSSKSKEP